MGNINIVIMLLKSIKKERVEFRLEVFFSELCYIYSIYALTITTIFNFIQDSFSVCNEEKGGRPWGTIARGAVWRILGLIKGML